MKQLFTMKAAILVMALGAITLFNSCKKDKCKNVSCPTGQICDNGVCVSDGSGNANEVSVSGFITSNTTWTSDKCYILNGRVVVKSGTTLTIEPGTLIKGAAGTGTGASVLIIERGAKIDAKGTAAKPIIFTSIDDNIEIGQLVGTNFDETVNEKWGGIIILGYAPVSTENGDTEGQIEGIPANETYGVYGGTNAADNSGFLQYVSIRHGGITIGDGNEINGLTLGGVGNGTTIDHVEVVANLDDGIECFGGTVNLNDVIVVYQGDDGLDIDQNYSGTITNAMVITGDGIGTDEAIEIDGPEGTTYTNGLFTIKNATFINEGTEGSGGDLKSKAQGTIENCSWRGFTKFVKVRASFSDTTTCTSKSDAWSYMTNATPTLIIKNSEVVSATATPADVATAYTGSCTNCGCVDAAAETALDNTILSNGNAVTGTASIGANASAFSTWSWASIKGKL